MPAADQYDMTVVSQGSWSASAEYVAGSGGSAASVSCQDLGEGSVVLTGSVSNAGNTIQAIFSPPSTPSFGLTLTAVCDIAGGALFTDGASYYLFSSGALSADSTYAVVNGFGAFSEALAPPICLAAGTPVQTARGAVNVEALRLTDRLLTMNGALRAIRWIGRQRVYCSSFAPPSAAWPIRVEAGAFGDGRPMRALRLSPNHAVLMGERLVPIRLLVNDSTICSVATSSVDYYHVELDSHDVIFADGLLVETYLDQQNRNSFKSLDRRSRWSVAPDRGAGPRRRRTSCQAFRPYADGETDLAPVRSLLAKRAAALGFCPSVDAQLRLGTDYGPLPTEWDGVTARTDIPADVSTVSLYSNTAVPSRHYGSLDHRHLGTAVLQIRLGSDFIRLDDRRLSRGWYCLEEDFRWTNGHADLQVGRTRGTRRLSVRTAPMLQYWSRQTRT